MPTQPKILFTLFIVLTLNAFSQKIKWKYRGVYTGEIPAYGFHSGNQYVEVESVDITIELKKKSVHLKIGENEMTGTFKIIKDKKRILYLNFKRPNDFGTEKLIISRKKRNLTRESFYPQPQKIILKKAKKRRKKK